MVVGLINSGDMGTIISLDLNTLLLLIQHRHRAFYPYFTELALNDCIVKLGLCYLIPLQISLQEPV